MNASPDRQRWFDGPFVVADPRTARQHDADQKASAIQHASMGPHDPDYLGRVLGHIRDNRIGDARLVQFDVVESDHVAQIATGELVVRTAVVEGSAELREALDEAGFVRTDVPAELGGSVERFVNLAVPGDELSAFARRLRDRGFPVSANHIAPMGYWIKSEQGPEHTAWRQAAPVLPATLGPVVTVIDTGIEAAGIRTDGWLDEIRRDGENVDELDGVDAGTELDLGAGHGTFASGIIRQVSANAEIRMVKALDSTGLGTDVGVAAAMVRAVREGARILNLSLGTRTLDDEPPPAFEAALELIDAHTGPAGAGTDVLIVAAAGNFGDSRPCWPAAFPRIVSVAALTASGKPSSWSSRGPWVSCSAVGEGISSPYVEGVESVLIDADPETFGPDDWAMWAGTSFAAPQIAGLAARLCAERGLTPGEACAAILADGVPVADYGLAVRVLPGT